MNKKNKKEWGKIPPIPPTEAPSDWYWFWFEGEKEPWVVEIWPNRSISYLIGWWGPKVTNRPFSKPFIEKKKRKKS